MNPTNVCKVVNEHGVIRGSTLKVCEGLCPKRIVLRHLEHRQEFVVHTEYMVISIREVEQDDGKKYPTAVFTSSHFDQGDYYSYNEFSGRTQEQAHESALTRYHERAEGFRY